MKPNPQTLNALRLALDLQAIADREGVLLAEVLQAAGDNPELWVIEWIKTHYFD